MAVHDVLENALEMLRELFNNLLTNADDHFFDLANTVQSNGDQVRLLEAMRIVRVSREDISRRLLERLAADVKTTWPISETKSVPKRGRAQLKAVNFDEITIQSDAQAEISAAKAVILSRGYDTCGRQHATLCATINSIFDTRDVTEAINPIGLAGLTERFCDALEPLSLDNAIVLSFLTLFEREVVANLGKIYSSTLSQLADLNLSILAPDGRDTASDATSQIDDSRPVKAGTMPFAELQMELAKAGSPAEMWRPTSVLRASSPGAPGQLVNALQSVQSEYLDQIRDGSVSAADMPNLQAFLLPMRNNALRHAGPDEIDVLRLISELFVCIFSNNNTSLACKELLARLQFPLLAMAILDKSFFSESDHPARRFLNRLAHDGIGWPASESALKKHRLYLAAEALVQAMIDAFPKVSRESFTDALERWEGLVAKSRTRTGMAERRVNEAVLGQARLNAARRIVEREVNRAAGKQLPAAVADFITNTWFHVLVMICMKYGTDSEQWAEAKDVYRDLVSTSCAEKMGGGSCDSAIVAGLIQRLTAGLKMSGRVDMEAWRGLDGLKRTLELYFVASSDMLGGEAPQLTVMHTIALSGGNESKNACEIDQTLSELAPGTWIEITQDEEPNPLRCRLVVIVDQTQTFVFANDEGRKVYESTAADLAEKFEAGNVRILEEDPLVDRAMEDLVDQLAGR